MEQLLCRYLMNNRNCPLPGIGSLCITEQTAKALGPDNLILAPMPVIELREKDLPADDLISYLVSENNTSPDAANEWLNRFCDDIKAMEPDSELTLHGAGKFFVDGEGVLGFKAIPIDAALIPAVEAKRVIHPSQVHQMVVGDRQTNTAEMTAFYAVEENESRKKWWLWAGVVCIIALLVFIIYMFTSENRGSFGNASPAKLSQPPVTHSTIP